MKRKKIKKDDLVVVVKPWDDRIVYLKVGTVLQREEEKDGHYLVTYTEPSSRYHPLRSYSVWLPYCYIRANVWPEV